MTINDLIPYIRNAKIHDNNQIKLIAESIKTFGFNQPIVIDKNNEIIIGHGRYEASFSLGLNECKEAGYAPRGADFIPIVRLEDLTEEEVKALRLADNKLNESPWDMELVQVDLQAISPELKKISGFAMEELEVELEDLKTSKKEEKPQTIICPKCNHEFEK